ncbi:GSDH domain-containing protein [Psidium guajava]|nr:GSDH domain-containing protein [Psidium guajava]
MAHEGGFMVVESSIVQVAAIFSYGLLRRYPIKLGT